MNNDNGDDKSTMDASTRNSVQKEDGRRAEIDLEKSQRDRDIRMYKSLISGKSQLSDVSIIQIFRVLAFSEDIGDERALLASVAYHLHSVDDQSANVTNLLRKCWSLDEPCLSAFNENFQIRDLAWFKLAMIHGFLQANIPAIDSRETLELALDVLRENCLTYTKYTYVAYKILQTWMERASKMNFWLDEDTKELESKLEAVIFSNWDNCTFEIGRRNATQIFPMYLKLMSRKYNGFLEYVYENSMQNLSWQNVTKYAILVEVCKLSNDLTMFVNSGLISCVFTSLTKNHLKHAGTLVYLTILEKLKVNEWENVFSVDFFRVSHIWESRKEVAAIELLWEQWMKPSVQKFPNLSEYLWNHSSMKQLKLSQTYLARISDQRTLRLLHDDEFRKVLSSRIVDISETIRLNSFAFICRINDWNDFAEAAEPFIDVKRFLYFNAAPTTANARRGIAGNFKIFLGNVMKSADANSLVDRHVRSLVQWLHEFLLNCLEIGSSYQRKILGLTLYGIILNFTIDPRVDDVSTKTPRYEATLKCANALRLRMIERQEWKFIDRQSAIVLIRLAVDPMVDIREKAASIVIRYFRPDEFTDLEKQVLITAARKFCNPARMYEDVRGTALIRILSAWKSQENCVDYFIEAAIMQLSEMRKDMLKSASQGLSCYGALATILKIVFTNELTNEFISHATIIRILVLIEDATNFFLSTFSIKNNENGYSSSFAEMSIAIEATIKNSEVNEEYEGCVLSPAHQLVVFCIWMSLKACCELAAEIGCRSDSKDTMERTANLVVSVLLKCRHKGAIEAAGLASAKLTKSLCTRKYATVMEKHLSNLLSIDDTKDNINLTRRGAGLTIMFHRVVSSDDRSNRPFVHFAMARLLNSLRTETLIANENCQRDSTCARHLHFLRSLVADKGLQAQLVQYMEDVCLLCFRYLQSPEWTVRNASLQLFGAIVPRLVGQCSSKELDYGIGYSVDHFVTHYPILAKSVLDQLDEFTNTFGGPKNVLFSDSSIVSKAVPIFTLLSKMSTGGCDLVDYSSRDYIIRGKKIFTVFLEHPVFHVRRLAAKALAAFVPLAETRYELTKMKMRKINSSGNNHDHGQLLAQFYINRKSAYEEKCTDNKFVIRQHKIYEKNFQTAVSVQLARAKFCWEKELVTMDKESPFSSNIDGLNDCAINAMLLNCLIDCPVALSLARKTADAVSHDSEEDCASKSDLPITRIEKPPLLDLCDFLTISNAFKGQFLSCPSMRRFLLKYAGEVGRHKHLENSMEDSQLQYLQKCSLDMLQDPQKTQILLHVLSAILRILERRKVAELNTWTTLSNRLKSVDNNRPCVKSLRNIGYIIAIDTTVMDESLLISSISYMYEEMYGKAFHLERERLWNTNTSANTAGPEVATKHLVIDCLARFVARTFDNAENKRVFEDAELSKRIDFLVIVIDLLTDEDAETRELVAEKLHPLTRTVIERPGDSLCSSAALHKIITHMITRRESILRIAREIIHLETDQCNESSTNSSVHRENEATLQRDCSELINILYSHAKLIKASEEQKSLGEKENGDITELQQIDGAIGAKNETQNSRGLDVINIEDCFDAISPSDYLRLKKLQLVKICNQPNEEICLVD